MAETNWRELCRGLYRVFTSYARNDVQHDLLDRALAALLQSESDGPAVLDGREPASVADELSDEELAEAAKAAMHDYKYETELVYFLDSCSREYEPFLLALRAAIAADRTRQNAPVAEVVGPTDGSPPPVPLSEHDLRQQWNQQADEFNQWDSLDSFEQLAWAQARAIAADRARRNAPVAEGEGPSDDQLDLVVIAIQALTPHQPDATTHHLHAVDRGREILRQSLARWGHPATTPAPAAEGEVAELVATLRRLAPQNPLGTADPTITRAAVLLEQLSAVQPERLRYCPTHGQQPAHVWGCPECVRDLREQLSTAAQPPQSVPVSEQPPGAEGLNDKGECWEWDPTSDAWVLLKPVGWTFRPGPWLPAHALPLPSGEVQP